MPKPFPMPDILSDDYGISIAGETEVEYIVSESLRDFLEANQNPKARDRYDALSILKDQIRARIDGSRPDSDDLDVKADPLLHIAADAAFAWIESFRCYQPKLTPTLTEEKPKTRQRRPKAK